MNRPKRTARLQVRMFEDEIELLRAGAARANMGMSEFARFLLLNGSRGIMSPDEGYFRSLLNSTGQVLYARTRDADSLTMEDNE